MIVDSYVRYRHQGGEGGFLWIISVVGTFLKCLLDFFVHAPSLVYV